MKLLSHLYVHPFLNRVTSDGNAAYKDVKFGPRHGEWPDDFLPSEYQFYLHNVGFTSAHLATWCRQLDLAVEFLTAFDSSKRLTATRADHLIFNIENYLVRLASVNDRVLQLVNATFHLCINEEHVGHGVVISNHRVAHRPEIVSRIKAVKKCLDDYVQSRHTIIHKHSYLDVELKLVERLYIADFTFARMEKEEVKSFKALRARYLTSYVKKKKAEFARINGQLAHLLDELLKSLLVEYEFQSARLL